jgi:hypothetical protein
MSPSRPRRRRLTQRYLPYGYHRLSNAADRQLKQRKAIDPSETRGDSSDNMPSPAEGKATTAASQNVASGLMDALKDMKVVLGALAILVYGAVWNAYEAYYDRLGINPAEVGITFATVVTRAALGLVFFGSFGIAALMLLSAAATTLWPEEALPKNLPENVGAESVSSLATAQARLGNQTRYSSKPPGYAADPNFVRVPVYLESAITRLGVSHQAARKVTLGVIKLLALVLVWALARGSWILYSHVERAEFDTDVWLLILGLLAVVYSIWHIWRMWLVTPEQQVSYSSIWIFLGCLLILLLLSWVANKGESEASATQQGMIRGGGAIERRLLGIRTDPVCVFWTDPNPPSRLDLSKPVFYMGQANGVVVLFKPDIGPLRLPLGKIAVENFEPGPQEDCTGSSGRQDGRPGG